ncbi:Post Meiotic Segregation 2 [Metarhizium rileyi]|uniref:Post Meiotic Segregation 2 n=1 Tax=Metarhizium rileyi (strain RCEF 4871) TaxID=1649241 RepID=A0A162JHF9_METRR|nr:Post Meiotic Segregation 2 [Metarhizium rileyi RCEF 4871]
MAATIKPIDGRSSGQVIVDLCSVVKELVENSIDAGANIIDVRFKNQGLDLIEVQDNGSGICSANYSSIALKHHTSKLSSYSDIASLKTFGFRGEALASLCALSSVTITTCIESDVPRGSKLEFELSGKLTGITMVAAQRGTMVSVEKVFHNLPVRRRELERNIKREWHRVISLLNQYACIQTNLKFSVSQQPTKGKRILLFSTKSNPTTRENIINIFGSKATSTLVSLDLLLEIHPSNIGQDFQGDFRADPGSRQVRVSGHVSRPVHGDGRQTPDRQMFFVNGRPCGLPQFAKTFNEVYKTYNFSQSPFIFANIQLDTNMYDVNVSPDKRSILLHDQSLLLDRLRSSLMRVFDNHDYQLPATHIFRTEPPNCPASADTDPHSLSLKKRSYPIDESGLSTTSHSESDSELLSNSDVRKETPKKTAIQRRLSSSREGAGNRSGQGSLSRWLGQDANPQPTKNSAEHDAQVERDQSDMGPLTSSGKPVLTGSKILQASRNTASYSSNTVPAVSSLSLGRPTGHGTAILLLQERQQKEATATTSEESQSTYLSTLNCTDKSSGFGGFQGITTQRNRVPEPGNTRGGVVDELFSSHENGLPISDELMASPGAPVEGNVESLCEARFATPNSYKLQSGKDRIIDQSISSPGSQPDACQADRTGRSSGVCSASRRTRALGGALGKRLTTVQISQVTRATEATVASLIRSWLACSVRNSSNSVEEKLVDIAAPDAESKLPLIILKDDFSQMRVVGQFNLGFIIAVRPESHRSVCHKSGNASELFIIDQHASDEIYNFERLQAHTVVQSQRLVHPKTLQLTALEEEIVSENLPALDANGFKVEVDSTGASSVGSRCQLLALPLSRETTFTLDDLEELITLLAEVPSGSQHIPRPSKKNDVLKLTKPNFSENDWKQIDTAGLKGPYTRIWVK